MNSVAGRTHGARHAVQTLPPQTGSMCIQYTKGAAVSSKMSEIFLTIGLEEPACSGTLRKEQREGDRLAAGFFVTVATGFHNLLPAQIAGYAKHLAGADMHRVAYLVTVGPVKERPEGRFIVDFGE